MKPVHAGAWVMAAGVSAALHVGKLPPSLPVLQQALGISLLQAGFLLSLVQLAGMTLGLPAGLLIQRWGPRRALLTGLLILSLASAWGGAASGATGLLMSRALEGLGFLCVVLPAPGLLRVLTPPERLNQALGGWGAYMPLGTALALLIGPLVMTWGSSLGGWRLWWWLLSALSLGVAWKVWTRLPVDPPARPMPVSVGQPPAGLLRLTLRSGGAWLLAGSFAMYSGQWLAVVGFLPSIYAQAGVTAGMTAWLTALAAGVNIIGNLAAGHQLHRGAAPTTLLGAGFVSMGVGGFVAFGLDAGPAMQYLAVLVFSMVGGMIPATLFSLAVRMAPGAPAVPVVVGWMQQWSALGQFAGPPMVGWLAGQAGHWHWTWVLTGGCSLVGLALAWRIASALRRSPPR